MSKAFMDDNDRIEKPPRDIYEGTVIRLQVLDRTLATKVDYDFPFAIISIRDPGNFRPNLSDNAKVIMLEFSDIGNYEIPSWMSHLRPMTDEHARRIASFVEECLEEGINLFVIHCEAGISRSAGVAAAISAHYNGEDDLFFHKNFIPNSHVLSLVSKALWELKVKDKVKDNDNPTGMPDDQIRP